MKKKLFVDEKDMGEWKKICKAYCKENKLELLFVDPYSFGAEAQDGTLMHITIEDLVDVFGG